MNVRHILAAVVILGVAAACARSPMSYRDPLPEESSVQEEMQTAAHWDVLARDTAKRIARLPGIEHGHGFYIEPLDPSMPFGRVFANYLDLRMRERGLPSASQREGAYRVHIAVEPLFHKDRDRMQPGAATALGAGVWIFDTIMDNTASRWWVLGAPVMYDALDVTGHFGPVSEVVFVVSVLRDNRMVGQSATAYYIADAELRQYMAAAPAQPLRLQTPDWTVEPPSEKNFAVTNE